MNKSNRNILFHVVVGVFCYSSPLVDGIRSSTSLSSTSLQQSSDRRIGRTFVINTRGGNIGNEYRNIIDSDSVAAIPEATIPTAISGGEIEAENAEEGRSEADSVEPVSTDLEVGTTECQLVELKSSKWKDLITRVVSAAGMIVFLGGLSIYFKEDGLTVLVLLLQAAMYAEMTSTIGGDDWGSLGANLRKYWWFATAVIIWDGPKIFAWKQLTIEAIALGMSVLMGVIGSVLSFQYHGSGTADFREYIRQVAVSLVSASLVVLPSSYWIGTIEEHGIKWIFVPATFIAINDIMAYVFGRLIGKHPLLPTISPKKTWEGFLGAAAATIGTAWVALDEGPGTKALLGPGLEGISRTDGLVLAVVASTVAPFAGFLASIIKRAYGRKDFGDAFPGHGGFIDRLDCQLIFAPFVYFYLSLYKAANSAAP